VSQKQQSAKRVRPTKQRAKEQLMVLRSNQERWAARGHQL
jgi:hypothetical protein